MQEPNEEMVAGPRHINRRGRLLAGWVLMLLLALSLLTGETHGPGCKQPLERATARPWLAPDDPLVRNLHYAVLDRTRTASDDSPVKILPADVRTSARKLGSTAGVAVYLAARSGFACLGVDGRRRHDNSTSSCLLNTTIASQGLSTTIGSDTGEDTVLVVAVPDGTDLLVAPTTERLADYPNVVVLRPHQDQVYLHQPGQPLIALNQNSAADTSSPAPCSP